MSKIYINRVTVKKDGVYLSLRDESTKGYKSLLNKSLSQVYSHGGQMALDIEMLKMLYNEEVIIKGCHRSLLRYLTTMNLQVVINYRERILATELDRLYSNSEGVTNKSKYSSLKKEKEYKFYKYVAKLLPSIGSKVSTFKISSENVLENIREFENRLLMEGIIGYWYENRLCVHPIEFKFVSSLIDEYEIWASYEEV